MEENKLIAIKIGLEETDKILKYLASKPYQEVAELINLIQKSEPVYSEEIKQTI